MRKTNIDSPAPCLCVVHVPKAGGLTLIDALADLFAPQELHIHKGLPKSTGNFRMIAGHYRFVQFEKVEGEKFFVTCPREPVSRLISNYRFWRSLRPGGLPPTDPYLVKCSKMSFAEFVKAYEDPDFLSAIDNHMVRLFSHALNEVKVTENDFRQACANIEKMGFIFFTERLEQDISEFFSKIGAAPPEKLKRVNDTSANIAEDKKNFAAVEPVVTPRDDPEFDKALKECTTFDRRLYDFALALMEKRRLEPTVFPQLAKKLFQMLEGEVQTPMSPEFQNVYVRGWHPDNLLYTWAVADKTRLRFAVNWRSLADKSILRVGILPFMPPGRRRLDVRISAADGGQTQLVFLGHGTVVSSSGILNSTDFICAGEGPFYFDIALPEVAEQSIYDVWFEIGPRLSPAELGVGADAPPLAFRIHSLQALRLRDAEPQRQ